jgi:hypothetical protein
MPAIISRPFRSSLALRSLKRHQQAGALALRDIQKDAASQSVSASLRRSLANQVDQAQRSAERAADQRQADGRGGQSTSGDQGVAAAIALPVTGVAQSLTPRLSIGQILPPNSTQTQIGMSFVPSNELDSPAEASDDKRHFST